MLPSVFLYTTSLDLMELQLCVIAISCCAGETCKEMTVWQLDGNQLLSVNLPDWSRTPPFSRIQVQFNFQPFPLVFSTFACWLILIGKSLGIETGVVLCYSGQVIFGGTMSSFVQGQHDTTSSCDIVAFSCNSQSFGNGTGKQCIWYQS